MIFGGWVGMVNGGGGGCSQSLKSAIRLHIVAMLSENKRKLL